MFVKWLMMFVKYNYFRIKGYSYDIYFIESGQSVYIP